MAKIPLIIIFSLLIPLLKVSSKSDIETLLKLKQSLQNNVALSHWNNQTSPCKGDHENWVGVLCKKEAIWGIKLENMGLKGDIDVESLKELPHLITISFMNNSFEGPLPDLKKLSGIKSIYLTDNAFSGEIKADAFDGMTKLKKLHLGNNRFSGQIPLSVTVMPTLTELRLEGNEFEGELPDFAQERLLMLNVSHNKLAGPIPSRLEEFDATSFIGNNKLCGKPLQPCSSYAKLSIATIIINGIVVVAALAAIGAAVFIMLRRRRVTFQKEDQTLVHSSQPENKAGPTDLDKMEQALPSPAVNSTQPHKNSDKHTVKLTFLRDDRERFDFPDLLKASAEILGSGVFGSTYKADLNVGEVMVVKRFRHMNNVGKEEFQEHMRRLGRLRNFNVLPLVAFYYRKEEKLLVSDYVENVSLAAHLHGKHAHDKPSLDWPTRLKIVKGVCKGLLYLYNELPSLISPHGHLKSSNVLLNNSFDPILSDYALAPIINQEHAQKLMVAYKSPEFKKNCRITKKTDVWCLGILILEILTGIFPESSLQQGKDNDTDLATWVESCVREERVVDVFDKEMGGIENNEGDMVKLLNIGLSCCEGDVDKRWDMKEVVERIGAI